MQYYTKLRINNPTITESIIKDAYYLGRMVRSESLTIKKEIAIDQNQPVNLFDFGVNVLNNFLKIEFGDSFGLSLLDANLK